MVFQESLWWILQEFHVYSRKFIKGGCNSSFRPRRLLGARPRHGWDCWDGPWTYMDVSHRRCFRHLRPESKTESFKATESSSEGPSGTVAKCIPCAVTRHRCSCYLRAIKEWNGHQFKGQQQQLEKDQQEQQQEQQEHLGSISNRRALHYRRQSQSSSGPASYLGGSQIRDHTVQECHRNDSVVDGQAPLGEAICKCQFSWRNARKSGK